MSKVKTLAIRLDAETGELARRLSGAGFNVSKLVRALMLQHLPPMLDRLEPTTTTPTAAPVIGQPQPDRREPAPVSDVVFKFKSDPSDPPYDIDNLCADLGISEADLMAEIDPEDDVEMIAGRGHVASFGLQTAIAIAHRQSPSTSTRAAAFQRHMGID